MSNAEEIEQAADKKLRGKNFEEGQMNTAASKQERSLDIRKVNVAWLSDSKHAQRYLRDGKDTG
jgi:hypothetical protein